MQDYDEKINEVMEELHNAVHIEDDSGSSTDQEDFIAADTCDKETNTVSMYSARPTIKRRPQEGSRSSTIRRSQTFSPACRPGSQYVCRVSIYHMLPLSYACCDFEMDIVHDEQYEYNIFIVFSWV